MKRLKLFEEFSFPSDLEIGEDVTFIPMARHCDKMGIVKDERFGTVVAVKFTKAKVFYDVLDDYYGIVFDMVDSAYVKKRNTKSKDMDDIIDQLSK